MLRVCMMILVAFVCGSLVFFTEAQGVKAQGRKATKKPPRLSWSIDSLKSVSQVSAAVGDITGDSKPEIVFGTYDGDNTLYAVDGIKGKVLWKYETVKPPTPGCIDNAPALFDINGDKKKEVFFGSTMTQEFFCLSGKGKVIWKYTITNRAILDSGCAIGDMDGDKKAEVVFGAIEQVGGGKKGALYALNAEDGKLLWKETFFGICVCDPVLIDLNDDGALDVIVTIHLVRQKEHRKVYALNGKNGKELWSYKTGLPFSMHSVSVGDLTGDGIPELALGASGRGIAKVFVLTTKGKLLWEFSADYMISDPTTMADVDGDGRLELLFIDMADTVYCLKHKDGKPSLLWKTSVRKDLTTAHTQTRQSSRGVAVSDVSGDGKLDVIFCTCSDYERKVYALNGKNGSKLWEFEVTGPKGDTKKYYPPTVPVIEDLDGDGRMEVFFVAGAPVGKFYGRVYCLKTKGKGPAWTMSRRDLTHSGCVPVTKSKHSKKGKSKK